MNCHAGIKRRMAVLVLLAFVLVAFFSSLFIITHADHDCAGKHCVTCAQIGSAALILKMFGTAGTAAIFLVGRTGQTCLLTLKKNEPSPFTTDLISLKVRMNN